MLANCRSRLVNRGRSRMAQPAHLRQLVLGVLPSYKTFADPLFGHEARSAARRTWASASLRAVTTRFVVTPRADGQMYPDPCRS